MNQLYTHRYSVTAADMDTHYRITASAVLLYYQDCWARYMACLHMAAFDLVHNHKMWVISEFNASWEEKEAYWSQDIDVTVWNSELTGLRLYADFRLCTADGQLVSQGHGCWTLLDTGAHRPVPIADSVDTERLGIWTGERHKKRTIPAGLNVERELNHRVNPINLDFNGHVNNRTYLSIAMQNTGGDWTENQALKTLTIRWLHETFLGDTLVCRLWQTAEPDAYLHTISKDDTIVAQIYSELTTRSNRSVIDQEAPRT